MNKPHMNPIVLQLPGEIPESPPPAHKSLDGSQIGKVGCSSSYCIQWCPRAQDSMMGSNPPCHQAVSSCPEERYTSQTGKQRQTRAGRRGPTCNGVTGYTPKIWLSSQYMLGLEKGAESECTGLGLGRAHPSPSDWFPHLQSRHK